MGKIGVIGDGISVLAFKAFGLDVYTCAAPEDVIHTIRKLAEDEYGIIYITEDLCKGAEAEIARHTDRRTPAIIPIPGSGGSLGIGMANVKSSVVRAVGSDIVFGGED